ncbi:FAD-binding protein [Engelhardtia mirabilis]|uniref:Putative decaprenylphosphoryl-beta-D-ribose oxidase n=1 Tax=Engelhardtia mirabilis TaxID=2528011 RepID=A0A518BKW8_9BACT|nr:putative decaprenylphosphoryl-beta-D-ribose oxidase [Planctomycetes bacterium Pla133]QDV01947.1 putative decaprenylphosphoryl-beta-D-ribose oxidase [Planctomycetes bacterium Pla86]
MSELVTESRPTPTAAPRSDFEFVAGWGMAVGAHARVLRPTDVDQIRACFDVARADGRHLGLRGGGNSYGDASVNEDGHVLDIGRMNRILGFDAETGIADLEPGVTIQQLWREIVPQGFWPRVVSGTMFPTIAGAAAMNIHGKNNYAVGTIGDAILDFDLVRPDGQVVTCSRERNSDLFHAAIGGFGMLGVFSRIRLETKRVYSGDLEVQAISSANLGEMMASIEERKAAADYLVGWIDCFGSGDGIGRGLIHEARYLKPGEDRNPEKTLALAHQELPAHILGFPKSEVWRFLRPICNDLGMPWLNATKHFMGKREAKAAPHRQSHAAFAFLLDYVPGWKRAYGPGGLIQYQSFLPKETAHDVYTEMLRHCQHRGIVPYLGVFKRHRPDPFWLTHAVDGWSFAMDFRVTKSGREKLWKHCAELTEIVLAGGGKFYFAKDLVIDGSAVRRMFDADKLEAFLGLKRELDPEFLLQTNLWRRLFA